ncbi:hypothetical protein [Methylobacterium oxalidis]|uniref:Uncharacterized protein n=1 Tax=Methylobacterium oxalidis TaxID=944322 RepID=A0A512JB79_9HYPH|nr:hypothetical protein [Methylobacterium oxalidis]GEP07218.1 hypothetical protein MOX02_52560 [Methylobacterium oxalidis]GJE31924.1 hypothetical protein LDDCCGHA_2106 [Methylobacterium oxalidis]GLS67632.1 hypothetical protein GCM10007888_60160 [Methylobacterium oxalidis]
MKRLLLITTALCAVVGALVFTRSSNQSDSLIAVTTSPSMTTSSSGPTEAPRQAEQAAPVAAFPSFLQLSTSTAGLQEANSGQSIPVIGAPGLLAFEQAGTPDYQPDIPTGGIKPTKKQRH